MSPCDESHSKMGQSSVISGDQSSLTTIQKYGSGCIRKNTFSTLAWCIWICELLWWRILNFVYSTFGIKNSHFHTEKIYNFAQLIIIMSIVGSLVTFGILFLVCPFCSSKGQQIKMSFRHKRVIQYFSWINTRRDHEIP